MDGGGRVPLSPANLQLNGSTSDLPLSAWAQNKAPGPQDSLVNAAGGWPDASPPRGPSRALDASWGGAFPDPPSILRNSATAGSPARSSTANFGPDLRSSMQQLPTVAGSGPSAWRSPQQQQQQQQQMVVQAPAGMDAQAYMAGERAAFLQAYQQALPSQQALGQLFSAVDALHR